MGEPSINDILFNFTVSVFTQVMFCSILFTISPQCLLFIVSPQTTTLSIAVQTFFNLFGGTFSSINFTRKIQPLKKDSLLSP